MYSSFASRTRPQFWGNVRQRIEPLPIPTNDRGEGIHVELAEKVGFVKHPFSKVNDLLYEWKLPKPSDSKNHNFLVGKDGGVYYVDKMQFGDGYSLIPNILPFMSAQEYSDGDKRVVRNAITRLLELWIAEERTYEKSYLLESLEEVQEKVLA